MADLLERLQRALTSRYRIERELGRGGMATVYLAQDLKHDCPVAIKVLDPEVAAAIGSERFLLEVKTVARLTHLHILPLHDSGEADRLLFYVMPYVEGGSLRARLEREKQLPVEDALRIAREVAEALSYAHDHEVVHRDIKPENILLQSGHAVVADFGIARVVAAAGGAKLTEPGVPLGTPAYMSPEQWTAGGDLDGRSDLYSLGCVLYEMLAGVPPFTGPPGSLAHQHLNVAPRPVTELRPAVPAAVAAALERALAKTPADRFSTVTVFAEALGDERRRRPMWLVGGAVAAAVLLAVIVWQIREPFARWLRDPPTPTPPVHERSEIAVLPFQNLSGEGPHAYFAGGLHDELLTQLSKVAALKVISRTSVMGYPGSGKSLKTIADELGVGSIVEGSVQVVGGRLRVNVQLIDAATDEHLWAEHYDRTLDDAFVIQSEVAQQIVHAVGAALTAAEQERLTSAPTANAEAYRLYLQGAEYWSRPGILREDRESAQQLLERALAIDPNFALAHAALSQVHGQMHWLNYDPSEARVALQREEAEAALRLAPDLPRAHFAMGQAHYQVRRDYRSALDEFMIALEGLPNDAAVWRFIGVMHRRLGNWKEALAAYERGVQLNPRDADLFQILGGHTYILLHRYADAVRAYERALALAPDLHVAALSRARTYVLWQGQLDTLRAVLGRFPRDVQLIGGGIAGVRADLLLWERHADSLLQMPEIERNEDFGGLRLPYALYAAWAHQLRGDHAAARTAFELARVRLDPAVHKFPNAWQIHRARGMALAGLGRRDEALNEARWLQETFVYREDPWEGPEVAEARALILAQAGEADAALDEIERLLSRPSYLSVHTLRLDPGWDPIREHPRFKALLVKYANPKPMG